MTFTRRLATLLCAAATTLSAPAASVALAAKPSTSPTLAMLFTHGSWLGARPSAASMRGKVVLVDVFTFGCANCKNITPNLRTLYRKRNEGLAIVGVHTPETPYERERSNVVVNLARQGIVWPVVLDNDQTLWNAYGVSAWPTQLIFDRHGVLSETVVGDSQDTLVDATVKKLLAER